MSFAHLHLHTEYSLLDGECRISEIPYAVAKAGQTAVAITDHCTLYGAIPFFKACQANGIKPIIGCEVNVAARDLTDRDHLIDSSYSHLTILVKNQTGYENLLRIISRSYLEGFFNVPRTDLSDLRKYHEGLIVLTGCSMGYIPKCILSGNISEAKSYANLLKGIFEKDCLYLEVQRHGSMAERTVSDVLVQISKELDIPLVATNDVHYLKQEDYDVQHLLNAISAGESFEDFSGKEGSQYYLKTEEEMHRVFPDLSQAIQNTQLIADRCNFSFDFQNYHLPVFPISNGETANNKLERLCKEGYHSKKSTNPSFGGKAYEERIHYELSIIQKMGFSDYYLIVWDFISFARKKGIPVGPGRGSGVGSLVAYCIGITEVDPIEYGLIFERFLNPERVTMPDFDIDFGDTRRAEVIEYVTNRYGASCVAQIVTFGTMQHRQALRDTCKALAVPAQKIDQILRLIPKDDGMTIEKAYQSSPELQQLAKQDELVAQALHFAAKLEGRPRNASTHASGVVIADKPIIRYSPICKNDETVLTQFPMNDLSDLGLLKFDFLANSYLTMIHSVESEIKKSLPHFTVKSIPLNDQKVFELLSSGNTLGLFQLDSAGMRNLLKRMHPSKFDDIISAISLYRPGPALSIETFLQNRRHPDLIVYDVPQLKPILESTFGCILYQEEVMEICRVLAGYSYGRADLVRRAMAKKKPEAMEKERENFKNGCSSNGISDEISEKLFNQIASFAKYAFNKSHSVAYATVTYQTAYLKAYYPAYFMASLLNNIAGDYEKLASYVEDCSLMGIRVLPPDINKSFDIFTVDNNQIRYGLSALKNVGILFATRLIAERSCGIFSSVEDFLLRCGSFLNAKVLESLIKSGALDHFGVPRSVLIQNAPPALELILKQAHSQSQGQIGMFDATPSSGTLKFDFSGEEALSPMEKVQLEKEFTGLYLSGHPLDTFKPYITSVGALNSANIRQLFADGKNNINKELHFVGSLSQKRTHITKSNATMAFLRAEDQSGPVDLVIFPGTLSKYNQLLKIGETFDFICNIGDNSHSKSNDVASLIVKEVISSDDFNSTMPTKSSSSFSLYLRINTANQNSLNSALNFLKKHPGSSQTRVYFEDTKQLKIATNYSCDINSDLLSYLKNLLGEQNVAVKQQEPRKGDTL